MGQTFSTVLLDETPINQAILDAQLGDFYTQESGRVTHYLLEKFLARDSEAFRVVTVEQEFREPLDYAPGEFVWIADIIAANPSQIIVVDWKITATPDKRWSEREEDSWQWRLYCYFLRKRFPKHNIKFIYRGVSRSYNLARECVMSSESSYFATQVGKAEDFLRNQASYLMSFASQDRWPEYRSSGCTAFGRECPFLKDCSAYGNQRGLVQLQHLSHSTLAKAQTCPERLRMTKLLNHDDSKPETKIGSAVHAATAVAYKQMQQWQIETGFNNGRELEF